MTDNCSQPPTKKLRLSYPIANNKQSNSTNVNNETLIFKWDKDKILFFVIGYLRINLKMGIYDISTIIFNYIKIFILIIILIIKNIQN